MLPKSLCSVRGCRAEGKAYCTGWGSGLEVLAVGDWITLSSNIYSLHGSLIRAKDP